jgi:Ca-activated chloride channel family protein
MARLVPPLLAGGLCLLLTACGANGPDAKRSAPASADKGQMTPPPAPKAAPDPKAPDKANAEEYAAVVENPFRAVAVAPRSTFSADVNTASYSNVRRFLKDGKLPPRDAVLLAELVNYFPYRYPEPAGDAPVSLTLDLAPCPWKPEHKLARVGVKARVLSPHESPRRNLVFLIDVSGSMDGPARLPLVKQSIELLVDRLTPDDRVSIVTYAGDAGLKLPPTAGHQKGRILDVVRSLRAGGGTHGEGGIRLAYETARKSFIDGGANRVVLFTDGDFNVGQTSDSDLVQLIERERASRVFLTVLGYGTGNRKNTKLEQLANHGNGHYAYIDTLDEARKVFVEQGGALVCVAKDVKFQVEFNPARVGAYRLIGYENRQLRDEDYRDDAKDAGDIGSGHTVTALYELVPVGVRIDLPGVDPLRYSAPPQPGTATDEWLMVKMRYKHSDGDASRELAAALPAGAESATGEDFRFAAAVAEFGLVLRDSPHKGGASLSGVLSRAGAAAGYDPGGHRTEFLDLVRMATGLKAQAGKE